MTIKTHIETVNFYDEIETYERRLILDAINLNDGNKTSAAKYLTLKRTTLVQKLKALGMHYLLEPATRMKKVSAELDSEKGEFPAPDPWMGKYKKKKKKTTK